MLWNLFIFLDTNENIFLAPSLAYTAKILDKNILLLSWVAVGARVDSFAEKRSSEFKARDHSIGMWPVFFVVAQNKEISSLHVSEEKPSKMRY